MLGMSRDVIDDMHAAMPETERGGSNRPPSSPEAEAPQFAGAALAPPAIPQLEVSADITMRFALEKQKPAPVPRVDPPRPRTQYDSSGATLAEAAAAEAEPPPPSSRRLPPPRVAPPPPPSQPTLMGQGPPPRSSGGGDQPPSSPPPVGRVVPPPTPSMEMYDRAAAAIAYSAKLEDDLGEDAPTIARAGSKPPEPIHPAVKTARGLAVEPLLAEARAQANANGVAISESVGVGSLAAGSATAGSVVRTPRMPMPADHTADPRVQLTVSSGLPGSSPLAASPHVAEAIPIAPAVRPQPRTLVSATPNGEVSNGGFTPGSMTLPTDRAVPSAPPSFQDQTSVRNVSRGGWGKYVVVAAAFLLVFGTGLLLLKSQGEGDTKTASTTTKPSDADKKGEKKDDTTTPEPTATATAQADASASTSAEPDKTSGRPTRPYRGKGGASKPTSAPTAEATSAPTAAPTATDGGEDLKNPYR
jgi:hypothetical protein